MLIEWPRTVIAHATRVRLIYHDTRNRSYTQPLTDLTEVGTLIDPDTGDDMEIDGVVIDLPEPPAAEAGTAR